MKFTSNDQWKIFFWDWIKCVSQESRNKYRGRFALMRTSDRRYYSPAYNTFDSVATWIPLSDLPNIVKKFSVLYCSHCGSPIDKEE